ncbi:MAG: hypothetical protein ACI8RP_000388 [Urechidicola sp.]|jgi:hypothetical protein
MKETTTLYKVIEDKTIVWFEDNNEYSILENTTADILKKINKGISIKEIAAILSKKIDVPLEQTLDFIKELESRFQNRKSISENKTINDIRNVKRPDNFEFIKYYKINDVIFKISYLSEKELSFIHPKFSHLMTEEETEFQNEFDVFIEGNFILLYVNNNYIGSWNRNDIHYFQGKFSMELIQKIHQKEEDDWLGVFHASAISNGEKSMLFLGDSGNGKSTSLAILQANGFTCLADDFVPVDLEKQEVYSFPASISIKKNSLETLLPMYPELETSVEYNLKRLNKIVRYLKPNNDNFFAHLPCNDLVFIKYEKDSKLIFKEITKIDAFQQLVPDSWLSPKKENAQVFLDWFEGLKCYQLTYSKNEAMIETINKLFNDDL